MKNILVCVLVVFSLATVVRAAANGQIVGITVTGAGRTSHSVILSALGISPGDRVADRADFERRCVAGLYRMRVFGKAQARLVEREDGLELQLTVEEKWTLLPVPFVAVYQKKLTLGAGVLESNFLGTLNSVGGFFFLQDGTPGFFGFSHWALDASRAWSLSFSPQWMGRGVDLWDGQTKTGEYDERIGAVSFGISRKFSPAWELGVRLDAVWYRLGDGPFEGGYEGLPLALTLGYNGQQAVEDHIRGFQWKLALSADTGWFGTDLARTSASLQWSLALPIGPGGYIMLEQAGAAADGLVRGLEYRLGGEGFGSGACCQRVSRGPVSHIGLARDQP